MKKIKLKLNLFCLFFVIYGVIFNLNLGNCGSFVFASNGSEVVNLEIDSANELNVKKGVSYNSAEDLKQFEIQIPKPAEFKDVIILDAGHGYCDPGGGFNGKYEYIPNAKLIYKLANCLVDSGFFEVYITHPLNYAGSELKFDVNKNPNHAFVHVILPEIKPDRSEKLEVGKQNYSKKYGHLLLQALMKKIVVIKLIAMLLVCVFFIILRVKYKSSMLKKASNLVKIF